MNLTDEIKQLLLITRDKISSSEAELKSLPKGYMTQEIHRGKTTLVAVTHDNRNQGEHKRIRRTISIDDPVIDAYLRKDILLQDLELLKNNEHLLSTMLTRLKDVTRFGQLSKMLKQYSSLPESKLVKAFKPHANISGWADEAYERMDYKSDMKRHITSRGLSVRSKSELLIAEMLYEYDLPFRYESVLHFENITLSPDFTIRRADGKIFYWEHQGLTNSQDYLDHQFRKMQIYTSNNITPWDNLIVTYDNSEGDIDTRIIKSEIENKLL